MLFLVKVLNITQIEVGSRKERETGSVSKRESDSSLIK